MSSAPERVLSIQSHVVFGYVGGKAAVFPLQCLGYDVDVVNTVHFSNHSGYGRFGGSKATSAELNTIFDTLEYNEMLVHSRILTGYIPGAEALSAVHAHVKKLKKQKPDSIYLLDPVLGDSGRLYVAPDVVPIYKEMLPLSTIITPNWFEIEVLTDLKLKDMGALRRAFDILHNQYKVPNVVISSIPLNPWLSDALPPSIVPESGDAHLLCISSSTNTSDGNQPSSAPSVVHTQCVPLIPGYFSGVGDLFSALILAHFHPDTQPETIGATPLSVATTQALSKTHAILQLTHSYSLTLPEDQRLPSDDELDVLDPLRKSRRMKGRELALIKGQDIIRGSHVPVVREMRRWDEFWS